MMRTKEEADVHAAATSGGGPRRARAEVVELNVGGEMHVTTRRTLTSCPASMLESMFARRNEAMLARDAHGRVFIDRDGKLFRFVLNFLRNGRLCVGEDFHDLDALLLEAEFFALEAMANDITELSAARAKRAQRAAEESERMQRLVTAALSRSRTKSAQPSHMPTWAPPSPQPAHRGLRARDASSSFQSVVAPSTVASPSRSVGRRRRRRTVSLESETSTYSDMSSETGALETVHFDETLFDNVPDF